VLARAFRRGVPVVVISRSITEAAPRDISASAPRSSPVAVGDTDEFVDARVAEDDRPPAVA